MTKIDMALYKEIGSIIKRERLRRKISLDSLRGKTNNIKTKSTFKRYEDGVSRIDMDTLEIICNALDINYKDVIKEAESKVNYHNETNILQEDNLGDYEENVDYLSKNYPDLVDLYNEIHANDQLVILFDKAKKLEPEDLAHILKIIDTFNKETR